MFSFSNVARWRLLFLGTLALTGSSCSKPKLSPQQAGEQFFAQVAQGNAKSAYDSAAFAFQAQQSEKAFEVRLQELDLIGSNVTLKPDENDGKTARLDAEVITGNGQKSSLVLTMENEGGAWRVFSLKTPRSLTTGLSENRFGIVGKPATFNDATTQKMPDEGAVQRLVKESMTIFGDSIKRRSFTDFYNFTAAAWQAQLTENQLQRAFQAFIDKDVDLSGVAEIEPVLDPAPMIGTDGLLIVSGSYATTPYRVFFSLKFIYELPSWKLFGLDVNLRKAGDKLIPTTTEPSSGR